MAAQAVMSMSVPAAALAMQCENSGGSYVTGWSKAVQVYASFDAFYPVGPVDCCTPAVLLASGDAWELERCDCEISSDVHCGGSDTDRLLRGYGGFRYSPVDSLNHINKNFLLDSIILYYSQ